MGNAHKNGGHHYYQKNRSATCQKSYPIPKHVSNSCYVWVSSCPFFNSGSKLQLRGSTSWNLPRSSRAESAVLCSSQPPGWLPHGPTSVSAGSLLIRCRSVSHMGAGALTSSSLYLQNLRLYLTHINTWINKGMKKLPEWDLEPIRIQSQGYHSMEIRAQTQNTASNRIKYSCTALQDFAFSLKIYKTVLIKGIYFISDKDRPSHIPQQAT